MTDQQANGEAVAAKVGTLAALYASGTLDRPSFVEAFVLLIYAAKVRASQLAEVTLWRWSMDNWPTPIEPLGIVPSPDVVESLRVAAETITKDEPEDEARTISEISRSAVSFRSGVEIVNRSERIAADAAKESGRETTQNRMRRDGITAWRWVAQPDACDECQRRHGQVYRIDIRFRDHPQCECELEPATAEEVQASERARAAAIREKEAHARELADPAGAEHRAGAA